MLFTRQQLEDKYNNTPNKTEEIKDSSGKVVATARHFINFDHAEEIVLNGQFVEEEILIPHPDPEKLGQFVRERQITKKTKTWDLLATDWIAAGLIDINA